MNHPQPFPDQAAEAAAGNSAERQESRRRRQRLVLLIIVPLLVLAVTGLVYLKGGRYVETDNAYVQADIVPVSAEVSGRVEQVLVRQNQLVQAGDLLFKLDPKPFQIALDKAQAQLSQVSTDLAAMTAGYHEKQAEITVAQTRLAFALKEQKRLTNLVDKHFVSASQLDDARQAVDLAQQQVLTLQQDLNRIAQSLGGSADRPVQSHPSYKVAQAALEQARLDLAHTDVRASLTGYLSKPPQPGQYLNAGVTVMNLVSAQDLWVEANFTEDDLTYVRPGQPVSIHIDTFPDHTFEGVVDSLSPATGAEFSLIPAQNATGNWVKIAQRVPVRIRLLQTEQQPQLRAGLSAIATIDTGHHRQFLGLSL